MRALMMDQVNSWKAKGVNAAAVTSDMGTDAFASRLIKNLNKMLILIALSKIKKTIFIYGQHFDRCHASGSVTGLHVTRKPSN